MSNHLVHSHISHPWGWLDRLGMGLAMICAVHCLLTPVLVICLPLLATTFWVDHNFHIWMLGLVAPLTVMSVFLGCRKHKDRWLVALASIGISLLTVGICIGFDESHHGHHHSSLFSSIFPHGLESLFTTLGGLFLVTAHIRNYRLCRLTSCKHHG